MDDLEEESVVGAGTLSMDTNVPVRSSPRLWDTAASTEESPLGGTFVISIQWNPAKPDTLGT